ncbi:hypothetical protein FBEOM_9759 [Fusarium beomiforme]|uniref:Uncharacterized protein n=1 Tax=Fusarium beomiforme TaxID=44412 RepID=A0A9P5AD13_9HYPO|nr:hypothetical protein FBEOM_9759 [Fusarium beomiforme]
MSEGPSFEPPQPEGFQLNSIASQNSSIPLPSAVNHNSIPSGYIQVAGTTQVSAPTQAAAPAPGTPLPFPLPPRPISPQVTQPILTLNPAQATTATQAINTTPAKAFRVTKTKAPRASKAGKDPTDTKAAPKPRVSKPRAPKTARATKASKAGQISGATHASGVPFPQPAAPQLAYPLLTSGTIRTPNFAVPQPSTPRPHSLGPFPIPGIPEPHQITSQIAEALGAPGSAQTSQYYQTQQSYGPIQTTGLIEPQPITPQVTQAPHASGSIQTLQYTQAQLVPGHLQPQSAGSHAGQLYLPSGSAEEAIAGIQAGKRVIASQAPPQPVVQQPQQSQTKPSCSKKAKRKQPEKVQKQQPNKSPKRSIDRVEASSSVEGPTSKKTAPDGYWDAPGFTEAFKASRKNRREFRKAWAAIRPPRLTQQGALLAAELQDPQNQPMNSGVESSRMGAPNQQAPQDLPVENPQGQHVGGPVHPLSCGKFLGGVALSQLGLGPNPTLPHKEIDNRFKLIDMAIEDQQAKRIPILPASKLPPQAPKEFVGAVYRVPAGIENADLEEFLRQRNEAILSTQKQVDLERNNIAAKGTRSRRDEALRNLRDMVNTLQIETNWWRLKAVSLGADPREWEVMGDSLKKIMFEDMNVKVCEAEKAQTEGIKKRKSFEHSARNSENARLMKEDCLKKEKQVQALIAAIVDRQREIDEAVSQGRDPPQMNIEELAESIMPDVKVPVVTTGDTDDDPIPIDDQLYKCNDSKTDNCINASSGDPPTENVPQPGENFDAGGSIGSVNTTAVYNAMEVGNAIDINMPTDHNNTMNGNTIDTGNSSGTLMNEGSLPPNGWGSQHYGQMDTLPAMEMESQCNPWGNYELQDSNYQINCLPDGITMNNGMQNDNFTGFISPDTNLANVMPLDNGVIQTGPFITSGIQNTDFSSNGLQGSSLIANGFQRIDSLDDGIQGNASIANSLQYNSSINNGLESNDNPAKKRRTGKANKVNKNGGRATKKPENTRGTTTNATVETSEANSRTFPTQNNFPNSDDFDGMEKCSELSSPPGVITPRLSDFQNDAKLTVETSWTRDGNQSLFSGALPLYDTYNEETFPKNFSQNSQGLDNSFLALFNTQGSSVQTSQPSANNGSANSYPSTNDADYNESFTDLLENPF